MHCGSLIVGGLAGHVALERTSFACRLAFRHNSRYEELALADATIDLDAGVLRVSPLGAGPGHAAASAAATAPLAIPVAALRGFTRPTFGADIDHQPAPAIETAWSLPVAAASAATGPAAAAPRSGGGSGGLGALLAASPPAAGSLAAGAVAGAPSRSPPAPAPSPVGGGGSGRSLDSEYRHEIAVRYEVLPPTSVWADAKRGDVPISPGSGGLSSPPSPLHLTASSSSLGVAAPHVPTVMTLWLRLSRRDQVVDFVWALLRAMSLRDDAMAAPPPHRHHHHHHHHHTAGRDAVDALRLAGRDSSSQLSRLSSGGLRASTTESTSPFASSTRGPNTPTGTLLPTPSSSSAFGGGGGVPPPIGPLVTTISGLSLGASASASTALAGASGASSRGSRAGAVAVGGSRGGLVVGSMPVAIGGGGLSGASPGIRMRPFGGGRVGAGPAGGVGSDSDEEEEAGTASVRHAAAGDPRLPSIRNSRPSDGAGPVQETKLPQGSGRSDDVGDASDGEGSGRGSRASSRTSSSSSSDGGGHRGEDELFGPLEGHTPASVKRAAHVVPPATTAAGAAAGRGVHLTPTLAAATIPSDSAPAAPASAVPAADGPRPPLPAAVDAAAEVSAPPLSWAAMRARTGGSSTRKYVPVTAFVDDAPPVAAAATAGTGAAGTAVAVARELGASPSWHGVYSNIGTRTSMEDAHVIIENLQGHAVKHVAAASGAGGAATSSTHYFAVFDGHGGRSAAEYAAERLHEHALAHGSFQSDVGSALSAAFLATDAAFLDHADALLERALAAGVSRHRHYAAGSTALAAVLRGDELTIASLGDSRAVLGRADGTAVVLTVDHTPLSEESRIRAAGGWLRPEESTDRVIMSRLPSNLPEILRRRLEACSVRKRIEYRVCGEMLVARALGDAEFKGERWRGMTWDWPADSSRAFTADLITATPQVVVRRVASSDRFLILACDGLWEVMSSEEAVVIASSYLDEGRSPRHVSELLVRHALDIGSTDNVTAMVVLLHGPGGGAVGSAGDGRR